MSNREEKSADMIAEIHPPKNIADLLLKRKRGERLTDNEYGDIVRYEDKVEKNRIANLPPPPKTFVITCWDGDIYILTGYGSVAEIHEKLTGLEWARMPNGAQIKTSSIAKIQAYDDYKFQADQKSRHKRGQYINHINSKHPEWHDKMGEVGEANLKSITGSLEDLKIGSSPQKKIGNGQK